MRHRTLIFDLLVIAGGAALFAGLWQVYPPIAWIVLGIGFLAAGIWGIKRCC